MVPSRLACAPRVAKDHLEVSQLRVWSLSPKTTPSQIVLFGTMGNLSVELTAPNGVKYTQPTGLFINNEFVKATSGQTITSIDPA